jgi:hypothetical protein
LLHFFTTETYLTHDHGQQNLIYLTHDRWPKEQFIYLCQHLANKGIENDKGIRV